MMFYSRLVNEHRPRPTTKRCIVVVGSLLARRYGSFSDRCLATADIDTAPTLSEASIVHSSESKPSEVIIAGPIEFLLIGYRVQWAYLI